MRKFSTVIVAAASLILGATAASATTISIGDCSGTGCTVATGPAGAISVTGTAGFIGQTLGNWTVTATATGSPPLMATTLDSNTISVETTSGGVLQLAVTQQGNASPLGKIPYLSSFSVNPGTVGSGFSVMESTFDDPTNGLYVNAPADLLSSQTFTALGNGTATNTSLNDPNPFAVTDWYTINAGNSCSVAAPCDFNLTINVTSTPEPAPTALLGASLVGFAWFGRRHLAKLRKT